MDGRRAINRCIRFIDALNERIGKCLSALMAAMTAVVLLIIVLSFVFRVGRVWLHETVVYMHAVLFMLAAAYTLRRDAHVRIDIFYGRLSARKKAVADALGVLFFLTPTCAAIFYFSFSYIADSWRVLETSPESAGLPAVFLLKTCILLMPTLLLLQGFSMLLRALKKILRR